MCWIITSVIGFIIIKDIVWWTHFFKWQPWSDLRIGEGVAIFILFHFSVCGLAFLYRRIFFQSSLVFIYLGLQLCFYLLFLIKGLAFTGFPEQSWWLIIFALLLVFWWVLPKRPPESPVFSINIPLFGKVLIGLWLLSSLCLWVPDDLDTNRKTFMDEGFFWVNAAGHMVKSGIQAAHKADYPGGGLHPFGIPFMVSAPMTSSGWKDPWAVYCWPLVTIFSLFLWLFSQRWGRWSSLFFMSALLVVFANEFWPAQLMYALVYGESICVILLLVFLSEIWNRVRMPDLAPVTILALSGAVGLLALTKAPSDMAVVPLELTLLYLVFRYQRPMFNGPLVWVSMACSFFPSLIWGLFDHHYHILASNGPWHFSDILTRIPHPNTGLLLLAIKSMWGLDQNMLYIMGLSILLVLASSSMRSLTVPVLLWIVSWFFYYAYIYNYPDGRGDYFSGLRYMLPAVLVLYWAAACAYQETMDHYLKKHTVMSYVLLGLPGIFLVMVIFFRTCFII